MRRFRDYRGVEIMLSDTVLFDHILADHPEPSIMSKRSVMPWQIP